MQVHEQSIQSALDGPQTLWERAAETRWGNYLTAIEEHALLIAHRHFKSPGTGLEVGCEGGRWCKLLVGLGWKMTGTDINPDTLKLCEQRNPTVRCILVNESDETLPVESRSVDLLLAMEVPVVEASWFIAEAQRVLKADGMLVTSVLNRHSWRGVAANLKSAWLGDRRYYNTTYTSRRRALQNGGFSLTHQCGHGWPPFGRMSNSPWIPTAVKWERRLGLHRLLAISPWIALVAHKQ